jgi:hypothetical protein
MDLISGLTEAVRDARFEHRISVLRLEIQNSACRVVPESTV